MRKYILLIASMALSHALFCQSGPVTLKKETTVHGPETGSLLIIGGNVGSTASIWNKFTELAGGKEKAHIVVITAASGDSAAYDTADVNTVKRQTGITDVVLMHTHDLKTANSEAFIAPLKRATGVYFVGGRQWRIADCYLNTLTHQAFFDVLKRGGVIAGSSAGASIQGSFLWRGDTKGPDILIGDHTQGLGFLKNSVIDQHVLRRNRQFDLINLIGNAPQLIGIGLDEATAVLVQRDTLVVLGKSYVAIYGGVNNNPNGVSGNSNGVGGNSNGAIIGTGAAATSALAPFFFLSEGQKFDLKERKLIRGPRQAAAEEDN